MSTGKTLQPDEKQFRRGKAIGEKGFIKILQGIKYHFIMTR
jgi:hypothetical protein